MLEIRRYFYPKHRNFSAFFILIPTRMF